MNKLRLVQIKGTDIEELYYFSVTLEDDRIHDLWDEFEEESIEDEDFEDFIERQYPDIYCERTFVDEIYVD